MKSSPSSGRLLAIVTIVFVACIAAACGNGLRVRDSSGYAGTVTGYDTFDPMNYYDVWNGDTAIASLVPARSVTKRGVDGAR